MSMAYDPNSFGGFTPSAGDDPLGAQALLRRKRAAAGGGQNQSAFDDPSAYFFNAILGQLNAPPMTTPGAPKIPGPRPGTEDNPYGRVDTKTPGKSGYAAAGQRVGSEGFNWGTRTSASQLYAKYGNVATMGQNSTTYGNLGFMKVGEAAAPDFSRLIDLSNQAFSGDQGDFTSMLRQLQKDIGSGQQLSGTFESMAGAAAGGAAGAAMLNQLKTILAPKLAEAAQVQQGSMYVQTMNGNPLPGSTPFAGFTRQDPTVLQSLAAKAAAGQNVPQLKTNFQQQGAVYAR